MLLRACKSSVMFLAMFCLAAVVPGSTSLAGMVSGPASSSARQAGRQGRSPQEGIASPAPRNPVTRPRSGLAVQGGRVDRDRPRSTRSPAREIDGEGKALDAIASLRRENDKLRTRLHSLGVAKGEVKLETEVVQLRKQNEVLRKKMDALVPEGPYIVVDTNTNHLVLRNGPKTLLSAICSTGKGDTLIGPKGEVWIFRTPLGMREVRRKIREPIWTKPDWAFVEENEPIPRDRSSRLEEDVLGDYSLDIGDGYLIHGTLYTRLLGKPVTHGCVRLGDEDLKVVFDASKRGTRVYIF